VPGSELRGVESCRPPLQLQPHELVVRGIGDFSAHRIIGNELCVKDTSGQTCLTRSQVDLMLAASAAASAQALGDGAGAPTTAPTSGEPSASTTSSSTSASLVVETTPPSGRSIKSGTTTSAPSSPTTANPKRSTQRPPTTRPSPAPPPSTTGPSSPPRSKFFTPPATYLSKAQPTIIFPRPRTITSRRRQQQHQPQSDLRLGEPAAILKNASIVAIPGTEYRTGPTLPTSGKRRRGGPCCRSARVRSRRLRLYCRWRLGSWAG
jgi:hypothetical protein